ncbi:hypothetical protein N2601_30625 (plasmid) [Rhizobium sp. CB3060]|uniref:hypothetical protein n=1 Tax=Rhizobium sp. CB3060 TaxID=3138255 RepID=UPI0021A659C7|nr:hypothetical protein [Rhizobium tropici]UWU25781.1 hypothetical protein N2601_30625 [Rhizobium tropici]
MVEQTFTDMNEIRTKLEDLAKEALALSEKAIKVSKTPRIARSPQHGKSKRPHSLRWVANP